MTIEAALLRASKHPADVAALVDLARFALEGQCEEEALPLLSAAAHKQVQIVPLWQWAGLLHRALDDREQAIFAFQKARALAPNDALIAHTLARTANEAGLPAIALFERAVQLAPHDGSVLLGQAAALLAAGEGQKAVTLLTDLVDQNPGWIDGHRDLIQLQWFLGMGAQAFAAIERAIAKFPGEAALREVLITSLMQARRYEAALAALSNGRKALGDRPFFSLNEAVILSEQGALGEADQRFQHFSETDVAGAAVHFVRHSLRNGRIDAASITIERWLKRPESEAFWPYAALVWRIADDPRLAWLEGDDHLVRVFDLQKQLPTLNNVAEVLRGLHRATHQHLDQSVRGGTQTDGVLFSRIEPEIKALRAAIVTAVQDYIATLPVIDAGHPTLSPRRNVRPRFSGSWSVRLSGKGFHENHVHPAGWISSALYVAVPDRTAQDSPNAGWLSLGAPDSGLGLDLAPQRLIAPKPGQLVLFPSTMWHGTLPFSQGERLTVAFDIARPLVTQ